MDCEMLCPVAHQPAWDPLGTPKAAGEKPKTRFASVKGGQESVGWSEDRAVLCPRRGGEHSPEPPGPSTAPSPGLGLTHSLWVPRTVGVRSPPALLSRACSPGSSTVCTAGSRVNQVFQLSLPAPHPEQLLPRAWAWWPCESHRGSSVKRNHQVCPPREGSQAWPLPTLRSCDR